MSDYTPRGNPAKLIAYLAAHPELDPITSADAGAMLGIESNLVHNFMKSAVANGVLFTIKEGRTRSFTLTPPPEEQIEEVPFNAALWLDGDLVLSGVQVNEDGSVQITREQWQQVQGLVVGNMTAVTAA
ncbi:MAG: hypothetical protein V4669_13795 [Pseudomonadota bacterium]